METVLKTSRTFALAGEVPVNRIGYGAMRLTGQPGNFGPYADWEGGKALLRRALELGVNFFDTARSYGPGHNERLIAEALHPYPSGTIIATKGGVDKLATGQIVVDGSPATLAKQVEDALRTLRVDRLDLFQLHRVDPNVPIEDSVAALQALQGQGKIRFIGLSNVGLDQIRRALSVAPIASVQNRFNQAERADEEIIDFTYAKGIAFIPYGPLGAHPMQRGAPLTQAAVDQSHPHSSTPAQRALRWLLDRSQHIVVIPGTTTLAHLEENLGAWNLPSA